MMNPETFFNQNGSDMGAKTFCCSFKARVTRKN